MADPSRICVSCKKTESDAPNLKVCAKCKTTLYCSRECQKADWKVHKKVCAHNAANASSSASSNPNIESNTNYTTPRVKNLDKQIPDPFTRLDKNTYLHDRPDKDVFKLLIDCFRMRQEDDFKFEGEADANSVYGGSSSSIQPFRKFLRLASSRRNLLPPGWNSTKQTECETLGQSVGWSSLSSTITKDKIMEHYGDNRMPMQLRMLGETVYGRGPGGQEGKAMRQMMMSMEANNVREQVVSMMSL